MTEQPNKNRSSIKISQSLLVRIEDWQDEERKKTGRRPSVKELIERAWEQFVARELQYGENPDTKPDTGLITYPDVSETGIANYTVHLREISELLHSLSGFAPEVRRNAIVHMTGLLDAIRPGANTVPNQGIKNAVDEGFRKLEEIEESQRGIRSETERLQRELGKVREDIRGGGPEGDRVSEPDNDGD